MAAPATAAPIDRVCVCCLLTYMSARTHIHAINTANITCLLLIFQLLYHVPSVA